MDRLEALPQRLRGVDLDERLGAELPLDARLRDSTGAERRLGDLFDGKYPVVLTFNYADCPMLCGLQLTRFVQSLRQISRTVGDDFHVLTISIDPAETSERAAENKTRFLSTYGRPVPPESWRFLVGSQEVVRQVADSVGFSYEFNEARNEWLHPTVITLLTPDGKVSRYLYGLEYQPETLNLAIVEASQGKIGSIVDRLVLYCFHYDETEGRYAPVAMNIMRIGAGLTAVVLGTFLTIFWLADFRRRKRATLAPSTAT